jgi:DNA-binding GntR family transcriptional regulator
LLERILLGDYRGGTRLAELEIADELGVSRTPVREALLQLRLEGLVEIIPRGGIYVVEAPIKLIREITELRVLLEEYLAHFVTERRTDQWLEEYEQWLCGLEPVWSGLSAREWLAHDLEFHQRLSIAARNETLAHHLCLLQRRAVLLCSQATDYRTPLEDIIVDFRNTLLAVKARDFRACAAVLRQHVIEHLERIGNYMKPAEQPRLVPVEALAGAPER